MGKSYTKERTSAILVSLNLAQILQKEHPEIAERYREGATHPEIVRELKLDLKYLTNSVVASRAVGFAIKGYGGNHLYRNFEGLIPESELEKISRKHIENNGIKSKNCKKGIFSISPEETRKNALNGGNKVYEEGLGIHNLSEDERKQVSLKGVQARGDVVWKEGFELRGIKYPGEIEYAIYLASQKPYQHLKGKPNWKYISEEINFLYHKGKKIRTPNALKWKACKERKK